ncbi:CE1759 family FMN reductase [Actinoplanes sp. CA-131856]
MHLVSLSAGLRIPSSTRKLADRLTEATIAAAAARGAEAQARHVELRHLAHDITDALLGQTPSPALTQALDTVRAADALIATTPVYTASYSGLFKSFVDLLGVGALADVPVLMAATGGSPRHQMVLEHAMRPLFAFLRADTIAAAVFAAPSDWTDADGRPLAARIDQAGADLAAKLARRASVLSV